MFVILGLVLFLYGANYYNEVVGWIGFFLIVVTIIAWIAMLVYRFIEKRVQNP